MQDRAATIRSYTDHVTHEIKAPVAAIRAAVELLEDGALTPADRVQLAQIEAHGGRMALIPSAQGAAFLLTFPMQ